MFSYCPNCNNLFNITKSINPQKGGELSEDSIIDKILNKEPVVLDDIKININDIVKNQSYKKLNKEEKEYVYNTIQDLLPKNEKKIMKEKNENIEEQSTALFICENCGTTKKIPPGTKIFNKTSKNISRNYSRGDYSDMINSDILPRTRKYICINKSCISHTDPTKREAVFLRANNSYKIVYICTACKSVF